MRLPLIKKFCAAALALALLPSEQGFFVAQAAAETLGAARQERAVSLPAGLRPLELPALPPAETLQFSAPQAIATPAAASAAVPEAVPAQALPAPLRAVAKLVAAMRASPAASRPAAEESTGRVFDGSETKLQAFIVRPGQAPVATDLSKLPSLLASEPELSQQMNRRGHLRVMVAASTPEGGLQKADAPSVSKALQQLGLEFPASRTRVETVAVDWSAGQTKEPSAAASSGTTAPNIAGKPRASQIVSGLAAAGVGLALWGTSNWFGIGFLALLGYNALSLARESVYSLRQFHAAFVTSDKKPTVGEIVGAAFAKTGVVANNLLANVINYLPKLAVPVVAFVAAHAPFIARHLPAITPGPLHWAGFAIVTAWGLTLDAFHGAYVTTWDNFQKNISNLRGYPYQATFGFVYMQLTAAVFVITAQLCGLPHALSLFRPTYWVGLMLPMAFAGTICGSLGYVGLNDLYDKGWLSRGWRARIQQLREFFMLSVGPYVFSGNLKTGLFLFGLGQLIDLSIYGINRAARTKPLLIVADERVAGTRELGQLYPIRPGASRPSILKQLGNSLRGIYILNRALAAAGWLASRLRRRRR